ncbi:hypothetical protein ACS0TY_007904 [Phlomoides rotata]
MQFFGGAEISPSPPVPTVSGNNAHMLYIFNRNGICLLYREWNRPLKTLSSQQDHKLMFGLLFSLKSLTAKMDPTRCSMLFRFETIIYLYNIDNLFLLINCFVIHVSVFPFYYQVILIFIFPFYGRFECVCLLGSVEKGNLGVPQLPGQGCSFHSFKTNTYKLSFMESPSGIKLILVTHPRTGDLRDSLKYIYNLYVEYVVKNPLYSPGSHIR